MIYRDLLMIWHHNSSNTQLKRMWKQEFRILRRVKTSQVKLQSYT